MCPCTRLFTVSKPGLSNAGVGAQLDKPFERHSKHGFLSDSTALDVDEALIQEVPPILRRMTTFHFKSTRQQGLQGEDHFIVHSAIDQAYVGESSGLQSEIAH